jgi:hypothetical protein
MRDRHLIVVIPAQAGMTEWVEMAELGEVAWRRSKAAPVALTGLPGEKKAQEARRGAQSRFPPQQSRVVGRALRGAPSGTRLKRDLAYAKSLPRAQPS